MRVDAWLARPTESILEPSSDVRLRGVKVRGRSVSEPDIGDRSDVRSSRKLRWMLPRVEDADGLEMETPFDWTELSEFDLLNDELASTASTFDIVVVGVAAAVAVACLITAGRDGSARTVTWELLEALRRLLSAVERRFRRDSEGSVGNDGGIARGGSALVRSAWDECRPAGVGDGS